VLYQALSTHSLSKVSAGSLVETLDELDAQNQGVEMGEIRNGAESVASGDLRDLLAFPSPMTLAASREFWDERAAEARTLPLSSPGTHIMINGRVSFSAASAIKVPNKPEHLDLQIIGPIPAGEFFADDFFTLAMSDARSRGTPILEALKGIYHDITTLERLV
jgi:hypothetical protein